MPKLGMQRCLTDHFPPMQIKCQPLKVWLKQWMGFIKSSFCLEQNTLSKGRKCKLEGHKLKTYTSTAQRGEGPGFGWQWKRRKKSFLDCPVYSTNTIKLQRSILLHPYDSTLAQQIHQNRLNGFSWKWKQKTHEKRGFYCKGWGI